MMKERTEEASRSPSPTLPLPKAESTPPSPWTLGFCLLFAVSMCSSAGVVFDILTTRKGTSPFLAAFWRLLVQNIVQFVPFVVSLRKCWREDNEKKMRTGILENTQDGFEGERLVQSPSQSSLSSLHSSGSSPEPSCPLSSELLLPRYVASLPLCVLSGFFLGVHFSMWVFSMRYTSLTHSLLWVSMGPIIINGSTWFLYMMKSVMLGTFTWTCVFAGLLSMIGMGMQQQERRRIMPLPEFLREVHRPSALETFGAIFGIVGATIMLLGVHRVNEGLKNGAVNDERRIEISVIDTTQSQSQSHLVEPTVYGDVAAFSGALAVCIYLVIGRKVRSFVPIWLYVFPVIGFASLTCLLFFTCDYYTGMGEDEQLHSIWDSIIGFTDISILPYVIYLGVGPGIGGHTLLNTLLKYVSPLIVSTAMLAEPILGSIIGNIVGLQPSPGIYTWIGGSVLMVGLVLVVIGEEDGNDDDDDDENLSYDSRTHHVDGGDTKNDAQNDRYGDYKMGENLTSRDESNYGSINDV